MDSKQVLSRFEAERQALALMDHPNIAKVLDGGLHDHRPYFVMELVKGVPITDYCDRLKLTPRERLELFVPVCQAIQHAHQKGIIHRDIKPSNVLIALYDDKPVVKVIDFGVAKATGGTLTEKTIDTGFGGVVGTPQYMSPEQATFNNLDIDTRSDVYALGVLLYELLTGSPPIDSKQFKRGAILEMLRMVREVEPPRPSTRLSEANARPNVAANRSIDPAKLAKLLQGELDWVVMKALEKDRTRRYDTANGLARDIQRYLADEVVEARPPSRGYRLKKFVKRNKMQVIAGSLVLFALLVGIVGTSWGLLAARDEAAAKERARVEEARQRGIAEEKEAKADRAYTKTAEVLDAMVSEVTGDSLSTQKEISAEQKKFLESVLGYYREFAGENPDDERSRSRHARAALRVATIEYRLGRTEESVTAIRLARDGYASLAADFPTVPEYRQILAVSHSNLGALLADLGQRVAAEEQYRKGLAIQERLVADFPKVPVYRQDLAMSHNNLGNLLSDLGQRVVAEQYRKGLAIQESLVADFPKVPEYQVDLGCSYGNYGNLICRGDNPAESLKWLGRAIDCLQAVHKKDERDARAKEYLRNSHWGRAEAHDLLQKFAEAVKDWDRAIALSPPAEQPQLRAHRAMSRLNAGMVAEAVAEFAELTKSPNWDAVQWYDFACVYSVASGKLAGKKQEYADRAMELLQKAVKAGWKDADHLKKDTDLAPLRDRADLKTLIAELEKKAPPKTEPAPKPPEE